MKIAVLLIAIAFAGASLGLAQDSSRQKLDLPKPAPLEISKSLPANGTLVMELNVGELHVVRSDAESAICLTIEPHAFYDDAMVRAWVRSGARLASSAESAGA